MTETILFFAGRPGQGAPLPPARHGARRGRRVRRRVLPHEDAARQHPLLLVDQADLQHLALQVQEESQGEKRSYQGLIKNVSDSLFFYLFYHFICLKHHFL